MADDESGESDDEEGTDDEGDGKRPSDLPTKTATMVRGTVSWTPPAKAEPAAPAAQMITADTTVAQLLDVIVQEKLALDARKREFEKDEQSTRKTAPDHSGRA